MKFALAMLAALAEAGTYYTKPAHGYSAPVSASYKVPAATSYGYAAPSASYGYGAPAKSYGGYSAPSYQPAVVKKDYGLWEKYYRLETETFKKTVVTDTENVWVIAFIDPACGGCKRLAVEWEKLTTVETVSVRRVKFGYLDITEEVNYEIVQSYTGGRKVEYTPTVLVYGQDKRSPLEYEGDYKVDSLEKYVTGYCDKNGYGIAPKSVDYNGLNKGPAGLGYLRSIGEAALDGKYNINDDYYGHVGGYAGAPAVYGHGKKDGLCNLPAHAHYGPHSHNAAGDVVYASASAGAPFYGAAGASASAGAKSYGSDYGYGGYGDAYGYDDGYYGDSYDAGYGRGGYGYGDSYGYDDGYYGDSYGRGGYGYDDGYYGDSYGRDGYYGDSYGRGGYGYDDGYYGDSYGAGYGRGGYGDSYGYGYAEPKVVGVYNKSNHSRVEKTDYNRKLREGRQVGAYDRTSYASPAYGYGAY